ncbi:hypothetical protein L1278_003997 [Pontibacter sp. HSC-36F09]|nr:hypothetical protein [Pontibacter sp. HSC-36F09]
MNFEYIKKFVDISIQNMTSPEFDSFYVSKSEIVDNLLVDESRPEKGDMIPWQPSDSLIKDSEIEALESEIKHPLPISFKQYLKYKNFYELAPISNVWMFTPLVPKEWKRVMLKNVFNGWPKDYLYNKGMIPFANYSDWGMLCFDTNTKDKNGEYQIIRWDHENEEEYEVFANNFADLMKAIVQNYEEGIRNGEVVFY